MATEFNYKGISILIGLLLILICVLAFVLSAGCITAGKEFYASATATPVPTPTPEPTPAPIVTITTPEPTPEALPTLEVAPVDPYEQGLRSENQWYKWWRIDVQGLKDLQVGIIPYRHAWLDRYTWYDPAQGNYFQQNPDSGMRYYVVWVHEEMFGENKTFDSRMWGFDENAFRLQVNGVLYSPDETHNPVNRIKEFDYLYDYKNKVTAGPFSYLIRYTGTDPKTGGFAAERLGWIRLGEDNGFDGYIIFQVPKETKNRDILLLGNFASFGDAAWSFR